MCGPFGDQNNALLDQLTATLEFEFKNKPNSRCIIFVKTREIVRALLDYLSDQPRLKPLKLNPKQLTGAGARTDNFGELFGRPNILWCL